MCCKIDLLYIKICKEKMKENLEFLLEFIIDRWNFLIGLCLPGGASERSEYRYTQSLMFPIVLHGWGIPLPDLLEDSIAPLYCEALILPPKRTSKDKQLVSLCLISPSSFLSPGSSFALPLFRCLSLSSFLSFPHSTIGLIEHVAWTMMSKSNDTHPLGSF